MQLALNRMDWMPRRLRLRLPPAIPPFSKRAYYLFTAIWLSAFLLALVGPLAGFYFRYTEPANNSQLLLGSRAGFAVSPRDATLVRFTVGPGAEKAGIQKGDHIIAVYGFPLPKVMPVTEADLAAHADDPAYIAMGNLLFGTDAADVPLTVRGQDGRVRDVTVSTGEQHIDEGAKALGISPKALGFIDLLHIFSYPFLLWAAWILHRRNSRDIVSSILSLAVLLTIGAEQPSSVFLANIGVPRWLNVALYDMGNVCLLAGIILFPHGHLSWRIVGLIALLPILTFLHGQLYQSFFVAMMIIAVLMLLRGLRKTESTELRQQLRWALFGFTAYAVLRGVSIACDYFKSSTGSFGQQLLVEMLAGISLALGVLILQMGLLVALLRYRLYDAEVVISRSANLAFITVTIAAIFQVVLGYYGNAGGFTKPIIFAVALAAVVLNPLQEYIQRWSERKFRRHLILLRDDLPESVRDLRETASLQEMVDVVLFQVDRGVRAVRSAMIVSDKVLRTRGISVAEIEAWRASKFAEDYTSDICEATDKVFPIRVPLVPSSGDESPIGFLLVGPRPDGSIPSRDEQKALAGVSEAIARAIRTVIKRQQREQKVADLIADNARRIDELEAIIAQGGLDIGRTPKTA